MISWRWLPAPLLLFATIPGLAQGWTTKGADVRRTGQAGVVGPSSPVGLRSVALPQEQAVNMPPAVSRDGTVYVGTWGITRDEGAADRSGWNKFDGKLFALSSDLKPAWEEPFSGDLVPYCYHYATRPETPLFCPQGGTLNGYNGTVEGTPAFSADESVLYVGRGDGKLYALDPVDGSELWSFRTFNPEDPDDPEGGGEIVAGILVGPEGNLYFATLGAGEYETNAVYAVDAEGELLWRYPSTEGSWNNIFLAAPALSPDGQTLYVGGAWGPTADEWDIEVPGAILAFDLAARGGTGDERLKWRHFPINEGEPWRPTVWTTTLAVGSDGTVYGAGAQREIFGFSAVLFALTDASDHAQPAWEEMVYLDRGRATVVIGLALREVGGVTRRVYAASGNVYFSLGLRYTPGGKLYALDPQTGATQWDEPFDPESHGTPGSMTGIALGADGVIYTGVSGETDGGRVFAVQEDGSLLWQQEVGGLLEWSHPVLGPAGNLYFADTRRCVGAFLPPESGSCDGVDITPHLYAIPGPSSTQPCEADGDTLCLNGGRFRVEVEWQTAGGDVGSGQVVPAGTADSGLFWFFRSSNWELLVKVLDGCGVNGHFWVFAAGTTNVQFVLNVTDTLTGAVASYSNPPGRPADAITDTQALATCGG